MDHKSSHFQKIRFADSFRDPIFKRFDESDESYESSRILSTIDLRIHTNPVLPDSRIQSIFKRFVSWIRFVTQLSNTRFVDSICKTKNLKIFDSFCFGRIRIRIPHPYKFSIFLNILSFVRERVFVSSNFQFNNFIFICFCDVYKNFILVSQRK